MRSRLRPAPFAGSVSRLGEAMKSIERMVEEQVRRWEELRRAETRRAAPASRCPVITISRQAGSGGTAIARAVAEQTGFPLFDRELLTYIARRKGVMESVLGAIDRHGQSRIEESLALLAGRVEMSSDDYLRELSRAVLALSQQGGAVFVGRGAEWILPPGRRLAVRVIASFEHRTARFARERGLDDPGAAVKPVRERDERRRRFIRGHFDQDIEDSSAYDILINADRFSVPAAASLVASAHRALTARLV